MKKLTSVACIVIYYFIEMHNAKRTPNVIRIPLTTRFGMKNYTSANARTTTQIILDDDSSTVGTISIGQPKQNFLVKFDTGSTPMYVYSSQYDTCDPASEIMFKKHKLYNHAASSEFQQPLSRKKRPKAQLTRYITAWVFGFKAIDVITLGDTQIKKEFIEVTQTTVKKAQRLAEGLIGLRYHTTEGNIVTMICDKTKGERKFSYYLPKVKILGTVGKGELTLCGENKSKYKEDTMFYIDVAYPGKWKILLQSVVMETIRGGRVLSGRYLADVDTGTNLLLGTEKDLKKFFAEIEPLVIEDTEIKKIDCAMIHLLPNITFRVNTTKFTLTGDDYTYRLKKGSDLCSVIVGGLSAEHDNWILGEPVLRKYYTVFDIENHRIGMAENKG